MLALSRDFLMDCKYGDRRGAVPSYRADSAASARQCEHVESHRIERHSVGGRAGMQVARPAPAFRKLAHHLHPHEPLGQERRARRSTVLELPAVENAEFIGWFGV